MLPKKNKVNTISGRLKLIISDLNITQAELAENIGMTAGGLSDIIRGKTKQPSGCTLKAIEFKYGISVEWLLTGKEPKLISNKGLNKYALPPKEYREESDIKELIELYKKLDKSKKMVLITFLRTLHIGQNEGKKLKTKSSVKK